MSEALTRSARPLPPPDADFGYLFRLAYQRFRALLDSALEDIGLSAQDYGILSVLGTRSELSTSELARISQVTRQTMHTSVLSLEAAGLVERSARNQRVVLVRPTKRASHARTLRSSSRLRSASAARSTARTRGVAVSRHVRPRLVGRTSTTR